MNLKQCISSIIVLNIFFNIYPSDISPIIISFSHKPVEARYIKKVIERENKRRCAQFGIDYSDQEKLVKIKEFYDKTNNITSWHQQFPQQLLQKILTHAPKENIHMIINVYNQLLFPFYIPEKLIKQENLIIPLLDSLLVRLIFKSEKRSVSQVEQQPLEYIATLLVYASFFVPISLFLINTL